MDLVLETYRLFARSLWRPMESQLTDGDVTKRVLGGDRDAFRLLVKRYEKPVFTLCLRMLRNRDDAEDCAQTTFLKAYSELHSYHTGRSFKSWIYRIAANTCVDALRRAKARPDSPGVLVEVPQDLRDRQPDPRQLASFSELRQEVREALQRLDEKYRLPLVLFYMEGLECTEIAGMLRLSVGAVKTRMRRGRLLLREVVSQRCPDLVHMEMEPL